MTDETKLILEMLGKLDSRLDNVDIRLDKLDSRLDNVDNRLDNIDNRLDKLDTSISDIQLTIENETNKNIRIIAEGHLSLHQKLDEALIVENEKEMLLIRVNHIENELRRVKKRIEEIA